MQLAFKRIRHAGAGLNSDLFMEDETERKRLCKLLFPTGGVQFYTTAKLSTELPDRLDLTAVPGTGLHLVAYNETGKVLHLDARLS